MVDACDIIKSNTKIQTHKLCKETPILHELKCDFSTNTLNNYYTYKKKCFMNYRQDSLFIYVPI